MLCIRLFFIVIMSIVFRPGVAFLRTFHRTASAIKSTMVSFDTPSFTTKASNEENNDLVLDPLVVCGPSGVGKGTIIEKYMEEHGGKDKFGFTVSHTTRASRPGEENGIHYHFSTLEEMQQAVNEGKFLEHANVHGNLYGTSWDSLKAVQLSGKHSLLDIDVQGVQRLKSLENPTLQPRYIFIAPPSLALLQQRLVDRGTESAESLARRTQNAQEEVEYGLLPGNFDCIVVNEDLEKACQDFANAVANAYPDL